ncbi:M48 family metalloprotease [Bacteroidota bacterium]
MRSRSAISGAVRTAVLLLVVSSLCYGCSYQRSMITGKKTPYGYSWEQELAIGRESDPAIAAEYGLYNDDDLSSYVTSVGERVLAESHLRRAETPPEYRIDFTFRVLDSPILNAFALPGGYVYVTRGLLAHMENEAQLAMVLGHEVAHVAARHSSRQAFKSQLGQLGVVGGAVLGEVLAGAGAELLQVGSQVSQLIMLSYSRGSETESDELGVEYAAKAHYEAAEGAGFFQTLKRVSDKAGSRIPSWQSTHPDPGDREVKIRDMAAVWDQQLEMDDVGRERLLSAVDDIVVGTNPRQGFERGNVFYHPELAFKFPVPPGWTLYNLTTKVAMTDSKQQAVVIITLAKGDNVVDAASSFVKESQVILQDHHETTINGLDAYVVEATYNQNQQPLRLLIHFISYNGLVYQFLSYTYASMYSDMVASMSESAVGFSRLADQTILGIQPDRLNVITIRKAGALSSQIGNVPDQFEADDVAILNQLDLSSELARGQKLKLFSSPGE